MMYRSSALLGLTVWLVSGLVFSTATDDASCASNAPPSGQSPSLLAVKAETHSVAGLAVLEDAKTVNSTNASNASANVTLEGLVKNNVVDNMNEINAMPKLENRTMKSMQATSPETAQTARRQIRPTAHRSTAQIGLDTVSESWRSTWSSSR